MIVESIKEDDARGIFYSISSDDASALTSTTKLNKTMRRAEERRR
jgi:hypothetical protein